MKWRKKKNFKNEKSISELWANLKPDTGVTGIVRGTLEQNRKNIDDIMAKIFLDLMKTIIPKIQEAPQTRAQET